MTAFTWLLRLRSQRRWQIAYDDQVRLGERVEDGCSQPDNIICITGDEREPVHASGRREQSIDRRDRTDRAHASPLISDIAADREHAIPELLFEADEPPFESARLHRILGTRQLDSCPDLPEDEYAQVEIFVPYGGVPSRYARIATRPFPDFGDHVRIDQEAHRSMSRPTSRSRESSIPSKGADASHSLRPDARGPLTRSRSNARVSPARWGSANASTTPRTRGTSSARTRTSMRAIPRRFSRRRCVAIARFCEGFIFTGNIAGNLHSSQTT